MKSKIRLILIVVFLSGLGSCFSIFKEEKNVVLKKRSRSWINEKYIKCLETKLPCDCELAVSPSFALRIDTNVNSVNYGLELGGREFIHCELAKNDSWYSVGLNYGDSIEKIGTLKIEHDTVYFLSKNKEEIIKYFNIEYSDEEDDFLYDKYNVFLIDQALKVRGYPTLKKILSSDSLYAGCSDDSYNFIHGKDSKSWIIEQNRDSVYIYEHLNSADGKHSIVKKKLLKKYKW
jgi:hypothetical protein